jgi:Elongator subunit Iki1
MPPTGALLEKILSYKERSPLISILDHAGQSARPLLREFAHRAVRRFVSGIDCC